MDAKLHSHGRLDYADGGHEDWRYTYCGSDVQWVWVTFEDGVAVDTAWIE
ncbi:hypothetical protein [Tessaracoccus lacteus]|uniref:PepSY domain-containing protein n=1 Tax=Tessaracoccus lacteus TaxID=3041766 RepID=A0ABY8PYL0_9ACTN|nr:hypothetical protein [Tessaracoccus sp. T21]WGT47593.1 hypothetical protein QH948_02060 [Tessaracoccus sp. T21]